MVELARIRLLLADDHAQIRASLSQLLGGQPDMDVIGTASDGHAAVRLAHDLDPDVAVVDVSMPRLDGAQVTRILRDEGRRVRVIAFTRHRERSFVARLFEAGACGYVLKQSGTSELLRAIRAVARGNPFVDDALRPAHDPVGRIAG